MNIVITGDPVDGFTVYGPFDKPSEAVDWAADLLTDTWWVHTLHQPEKE